MMNEMRDQIISRVESLVLQHLRPAASLNRRYTSYFLKHVFERLLGEYLFESEFIEAMRLAGFQRKEARHGGYFYMVTPGSVKKANKIAQDPVFLKTLRGGLDL